MDQKRSDARAVLPHWTVHEGEQQECEPVSELRRSNSQNLTCIYMAQKREHATVVQAIVVQATVVQTSVVQTTVVQATVVAASVVQASVVQASAVQEAAA